MAFLSARQLFGAGLALSQAVWSPIRANVIEVVSVGFSFRKHGNNLPHNLLCWWRGQVKRAKLQDTLLQESCGINCCDRRSSFVWVCQWSQHRECLPSEIRTDSCGRDRCQGHLDRSRFQRLAQHDSAAGIFRNSTRVLHRRRCARDVTSRSYRDWDPREHAVRVGQITRSTSSKFLAVLQVFLPNPLNISKIPLSQKKKNEIWYRIDRKTVKVTGRGYPLCTVRYIHYNPYTEHEYSVLLFVGGTVTVVHTIPY